MINIIYVKYSFIIVIGYNLYVNIAYIYVVQVYMLPYSIFYVSENGKDHISTMYAI